MLRIPDLPELASASVSERFQKGKITHICFWRWFSSIGPLCRLTDITIKIIRRLGQGRFDRIKIQTYLD